LELRDWVAILRAPLNIKTFSRVGYLEGTESRSRAFLPYLIPIIKDAVEEYNRSIIGGTVTRNGETTTTVVSLDVTIHMGIGLDSKNSIKIWKEIKKE